MRHDEQEALFKKLASSYAETYGAELKKQLDAAEGFDTRQLDIKLRRKIKGRRGIYALGALAACLLLLLTLPRFFLPGMSGGVSGAPQSASNTAPQIYEMIPLSFELPDGFSVSGMEQDGEKTIYYIENTGMDDVVLTAELDSGAFDTTGLTELELYHSRAYARSTQGVNLLLLQKDGVLYTLSCRYDINTLIALGREII